MKTVTALATAMAVLVSCGGQKWTETEKGQYLLIEQKRGATLGLSRESGISLLHQDGYVFKDLNRNGRIDVYEDWRKPMRDRAEDLAEQLSVEEIAGLMLYSEHQAVPTDDYGYWGSTYNGTSLAESGLPHSALSDKQRKFLTEDNVRAVLLVRAESPRIAAEWNNNMQALVEGLGHGIPVNISSDPRNDAEVHGEFNAGSGGQISQWPCQLGLAATFDPDLVRQFAEIASREYRALGIATALSPQADIATDPRWSRNYGTFGESPALARDMVRAYIDGFQTSKGHDELEDGWGYASVNTMVKHWPGGGSGEGGRDAHFPFGKYSVYPGGNLSGQLAPFIDGAFRLKGKTGSASAIMPYYTISYGIDPGGQNVGNSYSRYIITDMLRDKYGYDGVVCTDWAITHDEAGINESVGKPWGRETMTVAQRHYECIKAGVDQFGGNNDLLPVMEAYRMWSEEFGEADAHVRFRRSAVRLLLNMFRTGLFDNPYVDPEETEKIVGCPEFMEAGYEAQLKSVIMLKNRGGVLPQANGRKVWFPHGDSSLVTRHFKQAGSPEEADFAFLLIEEPDGGSGYDISDKENGGNGYVPISLQYEPYTAVGARETSIAGGDPLEDFTNRSYKGKTVTSANADIAGMVRKTRREIGGKPLIIAVSCLKPFVASEIEPYADAVLLGIDVHHHILADMVSGVIEPYGLLPMQMPADMNTVERQCEDLQRDMECYVDSEGHRWDFAFGMNWSGPIRDKRVLKYE